MVGVRLADRRQSLDLRPREAVDLVVEERQHEGLSRNQLLDLPVDGVAHTRVRLDASLLGQRDRSPASRDNSGTRPKTE